MKEHWDVLTVREDENGKSWWTRVGVAFKNKDSSLSILLDALPVNGKLQVRKPLDKDDKPDKSDGSKGKGSGRSDGSLL